MKSSSIEAFYQNDDGRRNETTGVGRSHKKRIQVAAKAPAALGEPGISRFPCEVFPYVHGVSDRAGFSCTSRYRHRAAPHDSGPTWVANPLSCDFSIHYNLAGLTGAQGANR
jgi:hypothetical protein